MTLSLKNLLPAIAFFGGFLWDALTIGRQINPSDLWFLAGYLLAAGLILYWMGHRSYAHASMSGMDVLKQSIRPEWQKNAPIFILQFLFVLIALLLEFYHFISNFYYFQFHH